MDIPTFTHHIIRDVLIYTIPFMFVRVILYPIVNINNRLQRQYLKIEEEADLKEKYQKYQNYSLKEKIHCAKEIVKHSGFKGLYEKSENYLVPFLIARPTEGISYFICMRLCLDVFKLEDPFYLLTGLVFFISNLVGSFFLKFGAEIMKDRKNAKQIVAMLSPNNKTFWKQYEIEFGWYHTFGMIQGYIQLFLFWYFRPGFLLEILLFFISRMIAVVSCHPLALLSQWSPEYDYDHVKVLQNIAKRDGRMGLFAGARDGLINEPIFAFFLISGFHVMARII